jgi:hypothetical protein
MRAANNVAVDYRLLGRFTKAEELDRENIEGRTDVYGADHRETLFSHRMLARDLYGLGRYREARCRRGGGGVPRLDLRR